MLDLMVIFHHGIPQVLQPWNICLIRLESFNKNIGSWDVSSVIDMSHMFYSADAFNNGGSNSINNWDVSNVTNMQACFEGARAFSQDISGWDTSKVTNMSYMFNQAHGFNQDIGNWNVSSVTDFDSMFYLMTILTKILVVGV